VALACTFAAAIAAAPARAQELPTVASVDVVRYSGVWHEIARLPYKMQERCAADVTTTFTRRGMRSFDVETRCRRADGSEENDVGIARIQDTSTNAKMEIRFLPLALAWWPFAWSDYWILDLAPDYSHALIGVPARDSMWILARKPDLEPATYERLVAKARALGFDVDKLIRTKHTGL
jgi:apolipoprotein D and lipocalin family protein